jgi:anaerobic magnesium-protoporphyrin IX monomethyl ester cyclase
MSRILFINPNTRYQGCLLTVFPPQGILYISGVLLRSGHEVNVIDADIDNLSLEDISKKVLEYQPDIIGITVNTLQSKAAYEISDYIKKFYKSTIVLGGPHPSALKEKIFEKCKSADILIVGEGENTFLEIAQNFDNNYSNTSVKGICYKEQGKIYTNQPREQIINLDKLPFPALDLVGSITKYPGAYPTGARPSIQLMASRGCPFNCSFCSNPVWGKKIRLRSPDSVLKEVEWLQNEFKVKEIFFQDDTFNFKRDWFEAICNGIIERELNQNLIFKSPFRANSNLIDKQLLQLAKEAGFWMIFYGVESGNQDILNAIHKKMELEEIHRAIKLTKKAGIKTYASFIVGNIGETRSTIYDTINFAKKIDPDYYGFAVAMPYPGSELYTIAHEKGYLKEAFENFQINKAIINTDTLTSNEVQELAEFACTTMDNYRRSFSYKIKKFLINGKITQGYLVTDYIPITNAPKPLLLSESVIMGENDLNSLGPGWYFVENWPPKIRWMGKKSFVYLKRTRETAINIKLITYADDLIVDISANNFKKAYNLKKSTWEIIKLKLPEIDTSNVIKLKIEVNKTWIPYKTFGERDIRELGVAVEKIWLT